MLAFGVSRFLRIGVGFSSRTGFGSGLVTGFGSGVAAGFGAGLATGLVGNGLLIARAGAIVGLATVLVTGLTAGRAAKRLIGAGAATGFLTGWLTGDLRIIDSVVLCGLTGFGVGLATGLVVGFWATGRTGASFLAEWRGTKSIMTPRGAGLVVDFLVASEEDSASVFGSGFGWDLAAFRALIAAFTALSSSS